jgi:hypothetical protein
MISLNDAKGASIKHVTPLEAFDDPAAQKFFFFDRTIVNVDFDYERRESSMLHSGGWSGTAIKTTYARYIKAVYQVSKQAVNRIFYGDIG